MNRVESIGGTTTLFDVVEDGNNYCIGGCVDVVNKRIVWINWNDTNPGNHAIYCYDIKTGVTYNVLFEQYVEGGLGFSKYSYIHSCFIIGDLFYWTDGVNEPRRINLKRAINITHPLTFPEVPKYDTPIAQTIISQLVTVVPHQAHGGADPDQPAFVLGQRGDNAVGDGPGVAHGGKTGLVQGVAGVRRRRPQGHGQAAQANQTEDHAGTI